MPSEAHSRITINKLLEEAGWRFLPDAQGRRQNIICEHRVMRRAFSPSQARLRTSSERSWNFQQKVFPRRRIFKFPDVFKSTMFRIGGTRFWRLPSTNSESVKVCESATMELH